MVQRLKTRASGALGSIVEAKVEVENMDEDIDIKVDVEKNERTPKFSRMRLDWDSRDRSVISSTRSVVDRRMASEFSDAFLLMAEIYDIIREPVIGDDGLPVRDASGFVVWAQNESGGFVEDFSRLTHHQRRHYIGIITTRLFGWEQSCADLWAESMFAKAQFEERFAIAFDEPMSGTVDDRRAAGNRDAAEERYYAIMLTHLSRRADALVRSMDRLSQRLKDLVVE